MDAEKIADYICDCFIGGHSNGMPNFRNEIVEALKKARNEANENVELKKELETAYEKFGYADRLCDVRETRIKELEKQLAESEKERIEWFNRCYKLRKKLADESDCDSCEFRIMKESLESRINGAVEVLERAENFVREMISDNHYCESSSNEERHLAIDQALSKLRGEK